MSSTTSTDTNTSTIKATLNFTSEPSEPGAFASTFVTRISSNSPLHLKAAEIDIEDLRAREEAERPSMDREGFTWLSLPYEGLDGEEGWRERYGVEICAWLKDFVGAKECITMNTQIRRRAAEGTATDKAEQPVPAVHVDVCRENGVRRLLNTLGPEYADKRISLINIWRPLKGPVKDAPLALCDARSFDACDAEKTTDKFGGGLFMRHNPRMKWMYIRDQMPDEILVFRQFDSGIEFTPNAPACVPHTAFIDEERAKEGTLRESIEIRCAVVF